VTAANKTYDGTTAATITGCTVNGVVAADAGKVGCSVGKANFASANVGNVAVNAMGITLTGSAAGKYMLSPTTAQTTANITPKTVTAGVTAAIKTYDGTTAATITGCTVNGVVAADAGKVGCSVGSASFANAGPGNGIPVNASGITLTGSAAGKYMLSPTTAQTTANITQKTVTASVTAANKTYDGTTAATITGCTVNGVVAADAGKVGCSVGKANFASAGPGNGIQVNASGITLTGAAASHYTLSSTNATGSATISPANITSAVSINSTALSYNRKKSNGSETVTIKNTSSSTVVGPIEMVLAISGSATASGDTGTYNGNP
jgi:hypothetical protein